MNRLTILFAVAAIAAVSACGNNSGKKQKDSAGTTAKEQYLEKDLQIKLDSLVTEISRLGEIPVVAGIENGKVTLTEKEKTVKPEYLLSPSKAEEALTLSLKYRTATMLTIDMAVAGLYGMPVDGYENAISKLLVEIDNPAMSAYLGKDAGQSESTVGDRIKALYDACVKNNTVNLFWDAAVAGIIEQMYIVTNNIDKFMPCFTDATAYEVTLRFVLVHEGIKALISEYPELKNLENALKPLEVINAVNVEQLRSQLETLKAEIRTARNTLLS
ncbi:MAG TPA: hypothetical protein IAC34_03460 [Candidatus Coprenecus stercoripullorum]|nr:hypothetical protein [Candidatus Coprenecus stercoripullorum]